MKRIAMAAAVAAGLLWIAPGSQAREDLAKWHKDLVIFQDDSEEWAIQWHEMEMDSEVDFVDKSKTEHELDMEGSIRRPNDVDAVCVSNRLRVDGALDADGTDIYIKEEVRRGGKHRSGAYTAFHDGLAKIEVHNAELRKNAHAIQKLGTSAKIVVATDRTSQTLPAVVMEKYTKIHNDILVRISGLKMDENRVLSLTTRCRKRFDGLKGAFIESVYALDSEGKRIGGGRWVKGDPFGERSKITYEFKVDKERTHASFEFLICTKFDTKVYSFVTTELFQKAR
jgi:hypothetical protein